MLAQSLIDYGRQTAFGSAMQALYIATKEWLADVPQTSWLEMGAFAILLVLYWNRRSMRTKK